MTEFGHSGRIIPGVGCIDSWGAGPFMIRVAGRDWRFEDSDRFGPALLKRDGELKNKPYPPEGSHFWRAHRIWVRQGRRTEADGVTCIWDEPKPTIIQRISKRTGLIIEAGEEDGLYLTPEESAKVRTAAD